ncbi:MAG TPA: superoxide dismutase family protein [Methylomirabilota bacterium]|nr:superoxide dismutase family protein [Methylomirabilota bacterium]
MIRRSRMAFVIAVAAVIAAAGCQPQQPEQQAEQPTAPPERLPVQTRVAVAPIGPASGSALSGLTVFTESDGTVTLELTLENASPGTHGVHIHEIGDCSATDASSAGGHWNPTGEEHGKWGEPPFHLGDIGNVEVGEDGTGSLTMSTDLWSVGDGSDRDVVGKSVVVHSGADDFTTQPAGDSGERIGCGVIQLQEEMAPALVD